MEGLPVEVVGYILSRVAAARDAVVASATCRKWRRAFREHLRALSFESSGWPGSRAVSAGEIESMITRTMFQTTGVQSLVIEMEGRGRLSASSVASWLLYPRDNLRELQCSVKTYPKALNVVRHFREGSLYLTDVRISELDLSALLVVCPVLESLDLIYDEDVLSCRLRKPVKAPNLRRFHLEGVRSDNLILELDSIEDLRLAHCDLNSFKLIGKGSLKETAMNNVTVSHLDLCDSTRNLESIDIDQEMIPKSEFHRLVSKSSKLRLLELWNLLFHQPAEAIDLGMIAMSCPHLTHLSLGCDFSNLGGHGEMLPYILQGPTRFENLVFLDIGWLITLNGEFSDFLADFLEHCPSLKKLIIRTSYGGAQVLSHFITFIIRITRKYVNLDVQAIP